MSDLELIQPMSDLIDVALRNIPGHDLGVNQCWGRTPKKVGSIDYLTAFSMP